MLRRLFTLLTGSALLAGGVLAASAPPAVAAVGDITLYADPDGGDPQGITLGPDGNLWYTSRHNNQIGRIDPDDGTITTFADPAGNILHPGGITTGPDGNLWFTNDDNERIGRITPAGTVTTFTDPADQVLVPSSITAGPDGNLWFTSRFNDRIGRIDPDDGTITTFPVPTGSFAAVDPFGITAGPDGNLWFTLSLGKGIGRITPAGTVTTFSDPADNVDLPTGITAGPGGNLWFTSLETDRIGRITPAGAITTFADPTGNVDGPQAIATGPDGNLWFSNNGNNRIGRIDPDDGTFASFAHPDIAQFVWRADGITAGPDGGMWFTSDNSSRVGRIDVFDEPPTAVDDTYTKASQTLVVPAPGVLANDVDPDTTTLTATLVAGPSQGTVTLNADGSFTYTSNSALGGTDSFTYTANDAASASAPATVTITTSTPPSKDGCKNGGWLVFTDELGQPFRSQGQCVSWVSQHT